jgi:hypothetical protein
MTAFEGRCFVCRRFFPAPTLGDFSYGETLLQRDDGKAFAYIAYFDPTPFEEISAIVQDVLRIPDVSRGDSLHRVKQVVARCADRSEGLRWNDGIHICPYCGGLAGVVSDDVGYGAVEVQDGSYKEYHALRSAERRALVAEMWVDVRARGPERARQIVRDAIAEESSDPDPDVTITADLPGRYELTAWYYPATFKDGVPFRREALFHVYKSNWQLRRLAW